MDKIVALCSGGFDSVVMLHLIRETNPDCEIHTLFFDYGQKTANHERLCSKNVSEKLGCIFHEVALPKFSWSNSDFYSPTFSGSEKECLEMRNMVFISYAMSLCQSLEADFLYMAVLKSCGYYDTSDSFLDKIRAIAEDIGVKFITPFSDIDKFCLSYLAYKYKVTFDDFFTCDNPVNNQPCGCCPDCKALEKILSERPMAISRWLETFDPNDKEFQTIFKETPIYEMRVYVNHKCQLDCKHCYYGYDEMSSKPLTLAEYGRVFKQAKDIGIKSFHFSGKEPLYDDYVFDVIKVLREEMPESIVSFVTNGINVPKFINEIKEVNPEKVCLSVDSVHPSKDSIRGVPKVAHNALSALREHSVPTEVFIDLHRNNYKEVENIISYLNDNYGVKNFLVRTIVPIGSAVDLPKLSPQSVNLVYNQLDRVTRDRDIKCLFGVGIDYTYDILQNDNLSLTKEIWRIAKGVSTNPNLKVISKMFCERYENQITLTHDGYVQGCASESSFADYHEKSAGNVRDKSLRDIIETGKDIGIKCNCDFNKKFCCTCSNPLDF